MEVRRSKDNWKITNTKIIHNGTDSFRTTESWRTKRQQEDNRQLKDNRQLESTESRRITGS